MSWWLQLPNPMTWRGLSLAGAAAVCTCGPRYSKLNTACQRRHEAHKTVKGGLILAFGAPKNREKRRSLRLRKIDPEAFEADVA
eukprot:scaffold1638_cov258-Pinguiococcus_pyrenoidosus.AAC.37